ncbi:MAG: hypothetical protein C0434_04600 [Xanthomonadaceae bacterium]|nr:hypothetical protein [Xanthomonadaceae bacterium]
MDSPLGAVLGALVYGLWAFLVNRKTGLPQAAMIGCAHWLMSVVITMSCVHLMRMLFWLPARPRHGALLAVAGSLAATYTLLIGVHLWLGTPRLLLTLAPGLLPTIGFAVVYSALLLRESADPESPAGRQRRAALSGATGDHHART